MGRWIWLLLGLGACAAPPVDAPIERIGRRVESVRHDLALCYHDARVGGAEVRGIDFVVAIDFAQDPPQLRIRDGAALDPSLERCVLAVLRRVDFPTLDATTVDVPIRAPR